MLEYHPNAEVARIAGRLVDKWMQLEDRPGRRPPPVQQMLKWGQLPLQQRTDRR